MLGGRGVFFEGGFWLDWNYKTKKKRFKSGKARKILYTRGELWYNNHGKNKAERKDEEERKRLGTGGGEKIRAA